jgi:CDP-diacylglycerol--glycerol-3-phosphate 3-phosphatidyltransferase
MISIYNLKPRFQKLLQPLLLALKKLNITPNQITLFTILFSAFIGFILFKSIKEETYFLVVAFGLLIRMMLNALDGMMATQYDLQSKRGEILNEVGDIISDVAIYFPFIYFPKVQTELVFIFIILCIINEFCGILSKVIYGERRYDGPMGKSDRAFLVGIISLFLYFSNFILEYLNHVFVISIILIILSSFFRLTNSSKNE